MESVWERWQDNTMCGMQAIAANRSRRLWVWRLEPERFSLVVAGGEQCADFGVGRLLTRELEMVDDATY